MSIHETKLRAACDDIIASQLLCKPLKEFASNLKNALEPDAPAKQPAPAASEVVRWVNAPVGAYGMRGPEHIVFIFCKATLSDREAIQRSLDPAFVTVRRAEFDTAADPGAVETGHTRVKVGADAPATVTALIAAINASVLTITRKETGR